MCVGRVSLLSCLVPWPLLSTKPWFQSQCVLTCSCNITLHPHCPSSEPFCSPKTKWPQERASLLTGGAQPKNTLPFPLQTIACFSKTPTTFYFKLFTLPVGHLEDRCFCSAYQERRPFEPNNWMKWLLKSFWQPAPKPYLTNVNSSTKADWQDSQMQLGRRGMGKGGVLGFLH